MPAWTKKEEQYIKRYCNIKDVRSIAGRLGKSPSAVYAYIRYHRIKRERTTFHPSETICWKCKNSVPNREGTIGCSWSREFKPVKGWKAKKTIKYSGPGEVKSFEVQKCPEFIIDERELQVDHLQTSLFGV